MSFVFYLFGVLGLLAAGAIFVNGANASDAMVTGFTLMYAVSAFVGAMFFLAIGQALDHLAAIARNSRHLRLLDPNLAAEHARKAERGFLGLFRKEPTL